MVVEIVSECLDVGNAFLSPLGREMSGEQYFAMSADVGQSGFQTYQRLHSQPHQYSNLRALLHFGVLMVAHCEIEPAEHSV